MDAFLYKADSIQAIIDYYYNCGFGYCFFYWYTSDIGCIDIKANPGEIYFPQSLQDSDLEMSYYGSTPELDYGFIDDHSYVANWSDLPDATFVARNI